MAKTRGLGLRAAALALMACGIMAAVDAPSEVVAPVDVVTFLVSADDYESGL